MDDSGIPLLKHPVSDSSAFTAESLVSAVRAERSLSKEPVPRICVLDFDGDLTDSPVVDGAASVFDAWACFHTRMFALAVDGERCGIIARTIGGPFAVLVVEQPAVSGAELVLGLASAGRVSAQHAGEGALAVEMQAASLLGFSTARSCPVGIVAHVTNATDHMGTPFDKGPADFSRRLPHAMVRAGRSYLSSR